MIFVGIDPGKNGCLAAYNPITHAVHYSFLVFDKNNTLDQRQLRSVLDTFNDSMVFMEKLRGRAGLGATQTFNMGYLYGQVYSVVANYSHRLVPAQTWQKSIHAAIKPTLSAKERSQAAYRQLFPKGGLPETKRGLVENNLLDAFLIAIYGALEVGKQGYVTINSVNNIGAKK